MLRSSLSGTVQPLPPHVKPIETFVYGGEQLFRQERARHQVLAATHKNTGGRCFHKPHCPLIPRCPPIKQTYCFRRLQNFKPWKKISQPWEKTTAVQLRPRQRALHKFSAMNQRFGADHETSPSSLDTSSFMPNQLAVALGTRPCDPRQVASSRRTTAAAVAQHRRAASRTQTRVGGGRGHEGDCDHGPGRWRLQRR